MYPKAQYPYRVVFNDQTPPEQQRRQPEQPEQQRRQPLQQQHTQFVNCLKHRVVQGTQVTEAVPVRRSCGRAESRISQELTQKIVLIGRPASIVPARAEEGSQEQCLPTQKIVSRRAVRRHSAFLHVQKIATEVCRDSAWSRRRSNGGQQSLPSMLWATSTLNTQYTTHQPSLSPSSPRNGRRSLAPPPLPRHPASHRLGAAASAAVDPPRRVSTTFVSCLTNSGADVVDRAHTQLVGQKQRVQLKEPPPGDAPVAGRLKPQPKLKLLKLPWHSLEFNG